MYVNEKKLTCPPAGTRPFAVTTALAACSMEPNLMSAPAVVVPDACSRRHSMMFPKILKNAQAYVKDKTGSASDKPIYFVFHGGSGSSPEEIAEAVSYGVIKMNIDTDTQWSFWEGTRAYEAKNHAYLQGQIGNPEGEQKPNKKYYDPRAWVRASEQATVDRLLGAYKDLGAIGACAK